MGAGDAAVAVRLLKGRAALHADAGEPHLRSALKATAQVAANRALAALAQPVDPDRVGSGPAEVVS